MPTDPSITQTIRATISDEAVDVRVSANEIESVAPNSWLVRDGVSVTEVFATTAGLSDGLAIDGAVMKLESERDRILRERFGGSSGPGKAHAGSSHVIKAPMPGLVRAISVSVGEVVTKNATLLVLEAMKMENNINAAVAGRIEKIYVEAGKSVEKNMSLIEINTEIL